MPLPRVVLDTNVLVSALLTPGGVPAQVVALALDGSAVPLLDARILAEYRGVLGRQHFRFQPEAPAVVVDGLWARGEVVGATPLDVALPDVTDLPFLEVAVAGRADALVTGNARHFVPLRGSHAVPVLSPRAFLDSLTAG